MVVSKEAGEVEQKLALYLEKVNDKKYFCPLSSEVHLV